MAADFVIKKVDPDVLRGLPDQSGFELTPQFVILDDKEFDEDVVLCRLNTRENGFKSCITINQELTFIEARDGQFHQARQRQFGNRGGLADHLLRKGFSPTLLHDVLDFLIFHMAQGGIALEFTASENRI